MTKIRKQIVLLSLLIIFCCSIFPLTVRGSLISKEQTLGGKKYITIENQFVSLTFKPSEGGSCTKFVLKDSGENIVGNENFSGMFKDHWAQYAWPSGLMWLPYKYKLVGDKKNKIGIRLWIKVPARGGGKGKTSAASSLAVKTSSELIGLIVQKTIWLNKNNDCVSVVQEIKNPNTESSTVSPYIQHGSSMSGSKDYDNWYMPSRQGVVGRVNSSPGIEAIGPNWVLDPVAGWMAVNDRKSKRGMLFVFDYNYLDRLYTCGTTAEWFINRTSILPKSSFKTAYFIKPIQGFKDIVYGSKNVVCDVRPDETSDGIKVTFDIAAVRKKLDNVSIDIQVKNWKTGNKLIEHTIKLKTLRVAKTGRTFSFTPPSRLSDGALISVKISGWKFQENFEYYYAGDKHEHNRRYQYGKFGAGAGALSGGQGESYYRNAPRKHRRFNKPDFSKIKGPSPKHFKVLVMFGLYTNILELDDAFETWTNQGIKPEFTWYNSSPIGAEKFPGTYKELFSYNVVVLSDINYKVISSEGFEMLCDYVEHGGNLIVTGGPYALGNGEYEKTRFMQILPVKLSGPFDLKWAGKGKSWSLSPLKKNHPVLKGIDFKQDPRVFWRHALSSKKGAEVILNSGGKPVLVIGKYGKGQIAVLSLSPTGVSSDKRPAWWDWDKWPLLVRNIFSYLNRQKSKENK